MIRNVIIASSFEGICSYALGKEKTDYIDDDMMGRDAKELTNEFIALLAIQIVAEIKMRV
jgi:hypothetical protein